MFLRHEMRGRSTVTWAILFLQLFFHSSLSESLSLFETSYIGAIVDPLGIVESIEGHDIVRPPPLYPNNYGYYCYSDSDNKTVYVYFVSRVFIRLYETELTSCIDSYETAGCPKMIGRRVISKALDPTEYNSHFKDKRFIYGRQMNDGEYMPADTDIGTLAFSSKPSPFGSDVKVAFDNENLFIYHKKKTRVLSKLSSNSIEYYDADGYCNVTVEKGYYEYVPSIVIKCNGDDLVIDVLSYTPFPLDASIIEWGLGTFTTVSDTSRYEVLLNRELQIPLYEKDILGREVFWSMDDNSDTVNDFHSCFYNSLFFFVPSRENPDPDFNSLSINLSPDPDTIGQYIIYKFDESDKDDESFQLSYFYFPYSFKKSVRCIHAKLVEDVRLSLRIGIGSLNDDGSEPIFCDYVGGICRNPVDGGEIELLSAHPSAIQNFTIIPPDNRWHTKGSTKWKINPHTKELQMKSNGVIRAFNMRPIDTELIQNKL